MKLLMVPTSRASVCKGLGTAATTRVSVKRSERGLIDLADVGVHALQR